MTQTSNPLANYFRQPALYIRLPSEGQYWPKGSLDMPPNNELGVLPMTALDEISYRTPDALFNGDAVVQVIQSCVPAIKDAWQVPGIDLNTILTAIRIASNGNEIDLTTKCPNCSTENTYGVDLRQVIDQLKPGDFTATIQYRDLEIFFKPMSYKDQNTINLMQFEQQRMLQYLPNAEISEEERNAKLNNVLTEITKITLQAMKFSIAAIRTPQAVVVEPEYIEEFLSNCNGQLFTEIRDHAVKLRTADDLKPINLQCPECQHEYEQSFVLDTALFFGNAS
jgi:hypothetical protein